MSGAESETVLDLLAQGPRRDSERELRVLGRIQARLFGGRDERPRFDRFVLLERIGSGAGGVVYEAYDPELDRRVAVKIVRPQAREGSSTLTDRLVREAQALARTVHPNIVAVFDIGRYGPGEAPDDDGSGVFIVMELVDGPNLAQRIAEGPRPWRDALALMLDAGRGLAAAHAAGIVHRDFKPANVLLGSDGRVRVADFGLARGAPETTGHESDHFDDHSVSGHDPAESSSQTQSSSSRLSVPLTQMGAQLGTPAYMAPEQHEGKPADERSDQYAFCVTLFEILQGERPFAGKKAGDLLADKRKGLQHAARSVRFPARLLEILRRGLDPEPDRRFETMDGLLRALGRDPWARARRWGSLSVVGVALAGTVGFTQWKASAAISACETAAASASEEIWGEALRQRIRDRFEASALPYAGAFFDRVDRRMETFRETWKEARRRTCDPESSAGGDERFERLRDRCLARAREEAQGRARIFADADDTVVERAVRIVTDLPDVEACFDADALLADPEPPPEIRDRVEAIERKVIEAQTLTHAGRHQEASRLAQEALQEAETVGFSPTIARAAQRRAALLSRAGDNEASLALQVHAVAQAERSGSHGLAAHASVQMLCAMVGSPMFDEARLQEEAERLAEVVAGKVADQGPGSRIEAGLEGCLGTLRRRQGRFDEAISHYESALGLHASVSRPFHRVPILSNLGLTLSVAGRLADAEETFEEGVQLAESVLHARHPVLVPLLGNLAGVCRKLGRDEEARAHYQRALEIQRTSGPGHPFVILLEIALAHLDAQGGPEEALARLSRATERAARRLGPRNPNTALTRGMLGEAFLVAGRPAAALDELRAAAAILDALEFPQDPDAVELRSLLGRALLETGEIQAAREVLRRTLDDAQKRLGPDHFALVLPLHMLARVHAERGDEAEATRLLERAVAIGRATSPELHTLGPAIEALEASRGEQR